MLYYNHQEKGEREMKIQNVIDFYYNQYEKIDVRVEMAGGISGRSAVYSKKEILNFLDGFLDEKIILCSFQTHSYNYATKKTHLLDFPHLYILYQ